MGRTEDLDEGALLVIDPDRSAHYSGPEFPLDYRAEPGRLQVWEASSSGDPVFDLSRAEAYDDFVQVAFSHPDFQWIGLRENGELIGSDTGSLAEGVRAIVLEGDRLTSEAFA